MSERLVCPRCGLVARASPPAGGGVQRCTRCATPVGPRAVSAPGSRSSASPRPDAHRTVLVSAPGAGSPWPGGKPASGDPDSAITQSGRRRAPEKIDRYEVIDEIGRGGMGVVYRAWDAQLQRPVAIKVIPESHVGSASDVERFVREAQLCARLTHPVIVNVHEIGEHEGAPYIVMDLIGGGSLEEALRRGMPWPRFAEILRHVALALDHAHGRGVVHRDVKPQNVLLDGEGRPFLSDFGLAHDDAGRDITRTGDLVGTPAYMAPEQAGGAHGEVGPRTDVWALGAVLYRALAGRPPFAGKTAMEVLHRVITQEPKPPRKLEPRAHPDLETIALKCMEKDPERRYASAAAVADELARVIEGEPIMARPIGAVGRLRRAALRNPAVVGLASALGAVVVTLIAVSVLFARRVDEQEQALREREAAIARERALAGAGARGADPTPEVDAVLEAVRRGEIVLGEDSFAAAVERLTRRPDARAAERLAGALDRVTRELRAVRREVYLGVQSPTPEEASVGLAELTRFESVVDLYLDLEPGGRLAPAARAAIDDAQARIERRFGAALTPPIAKGDVIARKIIALEQERRLGPAKLTLAALCCEALGRMGMPGPAVGALGRYLRADRSDERAARAGAALARLGGEQAERWLAHAQRGLFPVDGTFWNDVLVSGAEAPGDAVSTAALIRRAHLRRATRDLEGARADFTLLIERNDRDADAYRWRGNVRALLGDARGAIEDLDAAHQRDRLNESVLIDRSGVKRRIGQREEALHDALLAVELAPWSSAARICRALAHEELGSDRKADEDYGAAIILAPHLAEALIGRGRLRLKTSPQDALADLDRAVAIDPDDPTARGIRGQLKLALGDPHGAVDDLSRSVALSPDVQALNALGEALMAARDYARAIAVYDKAIAIKPDDAMSVNGRGIAREKAGDLEGAIRDLRLAARLAPREVGILGNLGAFLTDAKDYEGAIEVLSRAIELDPGRTTWWERRSGARRRSGDFEGAIADLQRALEIDPARVEIYVGLAANRADLGDRQGAIADLERYLKLAPRGEYAPQVQQMLQRLRAAGGS